MSPDRWQRVKEILDVTLGLNPTDREEYLRRVCDSDR